MQGQSPELGSVLAVNEVLEACKAAAVVGKGQEAHSQDLRLRALFPWCEIEPTSVSHPGKQAPTTSPNSEFPGLCRPRKCSSLGLLGLRLEHVPAAPAMVGTAAWGAPAKACAFLPACNQVLESAQSCSRGGQSSWRVGPEAKVCSVLITSLVRDLSGFSQTSSRCRGHIWTTCTPQSQGRIQVC